MTLGLVMPQEGMTHGLPRSHGGGTGHGHGRGGDSMICADRTAGTPKTSEKMSERMTHQ